MLLTKILYSFFFIYLDFLIFLLLTDTFKVNFNIKLVIAVIVIASVFLHSGIFTPAFLLSREQFYGLLFLTSSLFLFHFAIDGALYYQKNRASNEPKARKMFEDFGLPWFNFMRFRLIYVMVLLAQLTDIWQ